MGRERGHRERKEGERREAEAASSEEWTQRGKEWRPACLGEKGLTESGESLSLKGTGYPGNRAGQHNYNSMFLWHFCFYREAPMCSSPLYAVNVLLPFINKAAALTY